MSSILLKKMYEVIIRFTIQYVLILFHFDLPLNTYDIFISNIDIIRRNKGKYFDFVSIKILP